MKDILLFIFLLLPCHLIAQKKVIEIHDLNKWPSLAAPGITNNGKFVYYSLKDSTGSYLFVQQSNGKWKKRIEAGLSPSFSKDSRYLIYIQPEKGLKVLKLGFDVVRTDTAVKAFKLITADSKELIAYSDENASLVFKEFESNRAVNIFPGISSYVVAPDNKKIALINEKGTIDISDFKGHLQKTIWKGGKASNLVFDKSSKQIAFIVGGKEIAYYKTGMNNAVVYLSQRRLPVQDDIVPGPLWGFDDTGTRLIFGLKKNVVGSQTGIAFDVWNYKDVMLQSAQILSKGRPEVHCYSLSVNDKKLHQLMGKDERQADNTVGSFEGHPFIIVCRDDVDSVMLKGQYPRTYFLVNVLNGIRTKIVTQWDQGLNLIHVSPRAGWVVYYDRKENGYISYNVRTGTSQNISKAIRPLWSVVDSNSTANWAPPVISGWYNGEEAVLINDKYGIWKVDPGTGFNPELVTPELTSGNKVIYFPALKEKEYKKGQPILLKGFNTVNKAYGFYKLMIGARPELEELHAGPFMYERKFGKYRQLDELVKAKDADIYILRREDAQSYPNYYLTTDFYNFEKITNLQPEKSFNWLRSELHRIELPGGDSSQGVLYKPHDFDSSKKYPVVIYYYEELSDNLNKYRFPTTSGGTITIPYYVSNGYLVFTPDVKKGIAVSGIHALHAAEGSYAFLKDLPFVDSLKIGLCGHSFGGYETNFIITHSKHFAAAYSGAGVSDLISQFGGLWPSTGDSYNNHTEYGQYRMNEAPWDNSDSYVKNSPIFFVKNVETPLLMMHNKEDGAVPFSQSIEMFTALKRLGKKAWLLQYDNESHTVSGSNALDLEIRMKQFFDHYLKDAPAPKWMTRGITAKMKGLDDGLQLDKEIKTP